MAEFLRDVLAPLAQQQAEPFGPGRYRLWVRYFLDAELNLDELYSWGWAEFCRIEAELAEEARGLDGTATAGEVIGRYKGTSAGFELARYLGRPAQALTYKAGERAWLDGRENLCRAQGADFDLRRFHRTALSLDPLGLSQLRYALSHPPDGG